MSEAPKHPSASDHWLYRRSTLNGIYWGLVVLCILLGAIDFIYHRHTVYDVEAIPAIYGIFGFVCFIGIVFAGVGLRKLVMRDEDYYDR